MFATDNQNLVHSQDEHYTPAQTCDISSVIPSGICDDRAFAIFERCLSCKRHYILYELYKLSKLGPCTVRDIDLRFHVEQWVRFDYYKYGYRLTAQEINSLLEDLGLITIDEAAFDAIRNTDGDAADELFYQKLDEAIDYIENGICQNWEELCEIIEYDSEDLPKRDGRKHSNFFMPDDDFTPPTQYSLLMRKLLCDCFCYTYDEIAGVPAVYDDPAMRRERFVDWAVLRWLERMYCSFGDERSILRTLHLLEEIFGIDSTDSKPNFLPAHFWKLERPVSPFFILLPTEKLMRYVSNCLIDLWDELEEEYLHADFHKIHLSDFAPGKE